MFKYFCLLIIFFTFIFVKESNSQVSLPNEITSLRITELIKLDGILDEESWKKAQIISNFTQRQLNEGEAVTERTEVSVLYNDETLYIGAWCYESDMNGIVAKLMKRDFQYWTEDNFEVIFDTFHDKRNGYVFVVNPNGARADVQITNESEGFNIDWNAVWDAAVTQREDGWFVEIAIPFSSLKFSDSDTQIWGVNFERNIRRKKEAAFWQGWSRNWDFEHVSHAGTLLGLYGIKGKETIEIKPFITSGYSFLEDNKHESTFKIGGDINYLITPTLKLNLTANTDFAQVESDQMQINLSRFSLYYPEKREFFLEGKDFFEFNLPNTNVFYSRRIGLAESNEIPIIAGARVVGKQNNTNIGVLSMQTQIKGNEPTTNYSAVRLSQDVLNQSTVGMIFTSKNSANTHNYVYGVDANYVNSKFINDTRLMISGNVVNSSTSNDTLKRNLAYNFLINYPNENINSYLQYSTIQEGFNPEMGFLKRKNFKYLAGSFRLRTRPEFLPFLHSLDFKLINFDCYWTDITNELESAFYQVSPISFSTKSGDNFGINLERNFERLDEDFNIFQDATIPMGKYWFDSFNLYFNSFEGRSYYLELYYGLGKFYNGDINYFTAVTKFNLNKYINLSFSYDRKNIDLSEHKFSTDEISGRFEYSFNPKLYSSLYGQWNNDNKNVLLNFRIHWIPVIGSDFYLAVNQNISTENRVIKLKETIFLAKFIWRFGF